MFQLTIGDTEYSKFLRDASSHFAPINNYSTPQIINIEVAKVKAVY